MKVLPVVGQKVVKTEVDENAGTASQALWKLPAQLQDQRVCIDIGIDSALQLYASFQVLWQLAAQNALEVVPLQSSRDKTLIWPGQVKMGQKIHCPIP